MNRRLNIQTGLDPESRYAIWETVKKIQQNMSIVITTHSMEEADALCSRIAIMTNDGIQCLGTPIHLKNLYGKGFLFTVTFDSYVNDPIEYVKTHISPAERKAKMNELFKILMLNRNNITDEELFEIINSEKDKQDE